MTVPHLAARFLFACPGCASPGAQEGMSPQQVIEELVRDVEGGLLGTAGGRFFGWVIGGALPAAVAADWLASAWQQNAALYACSPAAAIVEETVGAWLKDILRLPAHASFALVTGCQMAHVTCLAAARHALLSKRGWNVESAVSRKRASSAVNSAADRACMARPRFGFSRAANAMARLNAQCACSVLGGRI